MLFSPLLLELGCSSNMPYHKDIQRNRIQQDGNKHCQRAIEKVEDGSENYSIDGSDDDEILDPPAEPF